MNRALIITGVAAAAFLVAFLFWWQGGINIIGIQNKDESVSWRTASLTGLNCENYKRRPIAVMMASDPIARPLLGISQADIVVEMPVTPNGITRMMAVFQCGQPTEIGSIRSAREDFIPLAKSFKAIYAHWGGEAEALKKLDSGIIDNIDALKYEGTVFYRKNSIPRPHNGFTTIALLEDKAKDLGYDLTDIFSGYAREDKKPEKNLNNIAGIISIGYESPYNVKWIYDSNSNTYKRSRGGEAEIDRDTKKQVEASIVVLMRTTSKFLSKDYINVITVGEGEAEFYQNGIKTSGFWKNYADNLRFYNANGQEMKFIPGKIWIEIVTE